MVMLLPDKGLSMNRLGQRYSLFAHSHGVGLHKYMSTSATLQYNNTSVFDHALSCLKVKNIVSSFYVRCDGCVD